MKRFDDKFADNVREAFDNFEEEMDPKAWEGMQQRLKKQKKTRLIAFVPIAKARVAGVAATLLLLIAGGVFFLTEQHQRQTREQILSFSPTDLHPAEMDEPLKTPDDPALLTETAVPAPILASPPETEAKLKQPDEDKVYIASIHFSEDTDHILPGLSRDVFAIREEPSPAPFESLPQITAESEDAKKTLQPDPFHDFTRAGKNPLSWDLALGSMLAFTGEQLATGPGISAGVVSRYDLTSSLSLSAGGLLSYHRFELTNQGAERFAADNVGVSNAEGITVEGTNELEMLALDIPVGVQLEVFNSRGRSIYLGAGLSSLLFLQQRFRGSNTVYYTTLDHDSETGTSSIHTHSQTFSVDETYPAFQRFDPGRLLNVSMGYKIRGERNHFTLEPFVKIPLGSIGSQNIRMGTTGISLKYGIGGNL